MWQNKLKEIIYILENSNVNEIELTTWGRRYRVMKKPPIVTADTDLSNATILSKPSQQPVDMKNPHEVASVEADNGESVLSPMPGTFYASPSPDAELFVQPGEKIKKGDTLCIIEAMKIMNEIEAEKSGIIKEVLVKNGQPVEYNQPLFILE